MPGTWRRSTRAIRPNTRLVVSESPTNPYLYCVDLEALGAGRAGARADPHARRLDVRDADQLPAARLRRRSRRPQRHQVPERPQRRARRPGRRLEPADLALARRAPRDRRACSIRTRRFLIARGIKTLGLRVERQNATALAVARALEAHPAVSKVFYPGLESHPSYGIAPRRCAVFGGVVSFIVQKGREAASQRRRPLPDRRDRPLARRGGNLDRAARDHELFRALGRGARQGRHRSGADPSERRDRGDGGRGRERARSTLRLRLDWRPSAGQKLWGAVLKGSGAGSCATCSRSWSAAGTSFHVCKSACRRGWSVTPISGRCGPVIPPTPCRSTTAKSCCWRSTRCWATAPGACSKGAALELAARMLAQGAGGVVAGDLLATVARMRGLIERPYLGVDVSFQLSTTDTGFALSLGVAGRPRSARLLRHLAFGAIRAAQRFSRGADEDSLKLYAETIGDRTNVSAPVSRTALGRRATPRRQGPAPITFVSRQRSNQFERASRAHSEPKHDRAACRIARAPATLPLGCPHSSPPPPSAAPLADQSSISGSERPPPRRDGPITLPPSPRLAERDLARERARRDGGGSRSDRPTP